MLHKASHPTLLYSSGVLLSSLLLVLSDSFDHSAALCTHFEATYGSP